MTDPSRLLDVNVLVALTKPDHVHAAAAHRWLSALPVGTRWCTCPTTEASYLRLMTNATVAGVDLMPVQVLDVLADLTETPGHRFLADPTSLANPRIDLGALTGPKQVTDFHLVNLAATCDAVLATFDRRLVDALAPADRQFVELVPA